MPPLLKKGGHIDLPLSVRLYVRRSVRPSRKVCITHNSETVCTIDLKLIDMLLRV